MRFSALHSHIVTATRPGPAKDEALQKWRDVGDRLCCCGFIGAGVAGYVFIYWLLEFSR